MQKLKNFLAVLFKLKFSRLLCLSVISLCNLGNAQSNSVRNKILLVNKRMMKIDSLPIDQESVTILGYKKIIDYIIDSSSNLIWKSNYPLDSIFIQYRVIFLPQSILFYKKEGQIIYNEDYLKIYQLKKDTIDAFSSNDNLQVLGNIGRNLGFGNQQDLAVNSDMNIKIIGRLNNDIDISASITDNTYPIQPEGNTRQIQEFDNVFVKLRRGKNQLLLGDHFSRSDTAGRFLKFYKKNRGVKLSAFSNNENHKIDATVAQARGRFIRNIITPKEGIQGPYRLTGPNNQVYIVVVAGTESVFVDGKELQRGLDDDYVIDYNTGEVTFMPKVLITAYSRIIVQFQYSDREYSRSIYHGAYQFKTKRLKVLAQTFLEQDNRFKPYQQSLDIFDSASNRSAYDILQNAGDNSDSAFIRSVNVLATFNPNGVNYLMKDSLGYKDIFVFSDSQVQTKQYFTVNFTFVGQGKGDYVPAVSFGNGKVFSWTQPVGGVQQGSYLPVVKISVPKRKSMQSVKVSYHLGKLGKLSSELAYSSFDQNLLSTKDDNNNGGFASHFTWETQQKINKGKLVWNSVMSLEHTQKSFEKIEQYRAMEFYRSWYNTLQNPDGEVLRTDEDIVTWKQFLLLAKGVKISNNLNYYKAESNFEGYRNSLSLNFNRSNWNGLLNWTEQNNKQKSIDGNFREYKAELSRIFFKQFMLGFSSNIVDSKHTIDSTQLLQNTSFSFMDNTVFFQKNMGKYWTFKTNFNQRKNRQADTGKIRSLNISKAFGVGANYAKNKTRLSINLNQRIIDYNLDHSLKLENKNTLLGNLNFSTQFWKNSVVLTSNYLLNNGRQAKQQIRYIEVPMGNGYYAWNDYNNNGIQELNEFTPSIFKDKANFVRIILPTNEFVNVSINEFTQSLNLQAPAHWLNRKGFYRFVGRFSNLLTYTAKRNISSTDWNKVLNPFYTETFDTAFTGLNTSLNNRLYFNKGEPIFGGSYQYFGRKNALYLSEGTDVSAANEQWVDFRYAPWGFINLRMELRNGNHSLLSRNFNLNNYSFDFESVKPKVEFVISRVLNLYSEYHYKLSENSEFFGDEKALIKTKSIGFNYSKTGKITLGGSYSHIKIEYDGVNGTPLAYDIMNGFIKGNNSQWNLNLTNQFKNNIQLILSYQGRSSQDNPTVHYGQARARYLF